MTDPTTEALNAAKREFWERISLTDADTIDQMNFSRILDTIEAQARSDGAAEERERLMHYIQHEPDCAERTPEGDCVCGLAAILDAPAEANDD